MKQNKLVACNFKGLLDKLENITYLSLSMSIFGMAKAETGISDFAHNVFVDFNLYHCILPTNLEVMLLCC
jgi:hypothetical protein